MSEFLKALGESKIPSLLLLGVIYYFGVSLLINSGKNPAAAPAGNGILVLAAVITIITAVDYRNKEYTDNLLRHYKDALDSISKTHSAFEDKTQDNLKYSEKRRKIGNEQYTVDSLESTKGK
jgi:hypothetical protein